MSPEDRELVTRSIANLWTFNAMFIAQLLPILERYGVPESATEELLQQLDAESDEVLDGEDDKLYAAGLLATVRALLPSRRAK